MPTSHITTAMRSAIGREFARDISFPIAASDIRRWAMAVYYPDPPPECFWKDGAGLGDEGVLVAPQEFNPFAWMSASGPPDAKTSGYDPDGHFKKLGVEGPGLQFQVNGGVEVAYGVPMRVGDVITSSSQIADLREREGRMGLMLFTTTETVLTNQDGDEIRRERMTIIRY